MGTTSILSFLEDYNTSFTIEIISIKGCSIVISNKIVYLVQKKKHNLNRFLQKKSSTSCKKQVQQKLYSWL